MGSPNFGGNSNGINVPMYAIEYYMDDELKSGILEYWLEYNDIDSQTIIDECGIDPMNISAYGELKQLVEWAEDNGYPNPEEWAEEDHQNNLDADYTNGKYAEEKINSMLDTNLLYMKIQSGYHEGYCVKTESPYWDSELYDINYEWIADDYDITVEEAHKLFDKQIDIIRKMQKSEFGGIGWRPHSGGYTGSFYQE